MNGIRYVLRTIAIARLWFSRFIPAQARTGGFVAVSCSGLIALMPSGVTFAREPEGVNPGPNVTIRGCYYYEHDNFGGKRREMPVGLNRAYVGDSWNDEISSIACSYGCALRVWEHRDFKGAAITLSGAVSYVGDAWNDKISSMKPLCGGNIVTNPRAFISGAGKCLDVHAPDQRINGAKVQVWDCNGTAQQTWGMQGKTIRSSAGKCLDVHAPDQQSNGGRIQVWDCNGSLQQQFEWDGRMRVIRTGAGKCVDVHAPDQQSNGGRVQVWDCNNTQQQTWDVRAQ